MSKKLKMNRTAVKAAAQNETPVAAEQETTATQDTAQENAAPQDTAQENAAPQDGIPTATPKPQRVRRPAGLGHPEAKKLVNPQNTLELKKSTALSLGGKMLWGSKVWTIVLPSGNIVFSSRELAALSNAQFKDRISAALSNETIVLETPPAAQEIPAAEQENASEQHIDQAA